MGKEPKGSTLPERYKPGFLGDLDRRSQVYRRLQEIREEIVEDLGGEDNLSHVQITLVERFTFLECCLQTWESMIASKPQDSDELIGRWTQMCNAIQGLAKTLGIERKPRKARDLRSYLKERRA